jgi:hypothetical protein
LDEQTKEKLVVLAATATATAATVHDEDCAASLRVWAWEVAEAAREGRTPRLPVPSPPRDRLWLVQVKSSVPSTTPDLLIHLRSAASGEGG